MKFVDEATIKVFAGRGGHGHMGFRREKFIPLGGPDGGDGGDGGSVYLVADFNLNTLANFRYQRIHRAKNGESGGRRLRTGKSADDLLIPVPVGTVVFDANTDEKIGELLKADERLCVAQGGFHGLGNARFKSSVNRAPRQTTKGSEGEERELRLELLVLADVGLLGLPNAGKSTLVRAISNATPKVADYPFTTLNPQLGVVRVDDLRSFVVADIPGLIAGASEGVGLGVQFLKHLSRTRLLLHVVDVLPLDEHDPADQIQQLFHELKQFSEELADKPRWLVFNKIDLLPAEELAATVERITKKLNWKGPVYLISALAKEGLQKLCYDIMDYLEKTALQSAE